VTCFQTHTFRLLLLGGFYVLFGLGLAVNDSWAGFELSAAGGVMSGYSQYEIGGRTVYPSGVTEYHFPISRLRFPVDTALMKVKGLARAGEHWLFSLEMATNLTENTGEMKDYDWGIYSGSAPDQLDIYSESDCDMEFYQFDVKGRYQITELNLGYSSRGNWHLIPAVGGGFKYQHYDFSTYDLDQWSPSHPEIDAVHASGKVLTYIAAYEIPYLELSCSLILPDKLSFDLGLAYAPWLNFRDRDDHLLRDRVAKADHHWNGSGIMVNSSMRYDLEHNWFVTADMELVYLQSKGRSAVYESGAWHHSIQEKVASRQSSVSLSLGYRF
jgi:outer membrane protease